MGEKLSKTNPKSCFSLLFTIAIKRRNALKKQKNKEQHNSRYPNIDP
jgi:hypothetical protein